MSAAFPMRRTVESSVKRIASGSGGVILGRGAVVVLDALTYAGRRENLDGIPARSLTFVHGDISEPGSLATTIEQSTGAVRKAVAERAHALEQLGRGSMMKHVAAHLRSADGETFDLLISDLSGKPLWDGPVPLTDQAAGFADVFHPGEHRRHRGGDRVRPARASPACAGPPERGPRPRR